MPDDTPSILRSVRENALGFAYNAPRVLRQIELALTDHRARGIAVAQADVIAHSMGGLVVRRAKRLAEFIGPQSYGAGPINRLITIGTQHYGTPLATQLLQSSNSCIRNYLADNSQISIAIAIVGGVPLSGGVGDAQGNGWGSAMSNALTSLQTGVPATPTAMIFGTATNSNLSSLDQIGSGAWLLRRACPSDPLANSMTSQGVPAIFGQPSDGIVPRTSQIAGSNGTELPNTVHTRALHDLGFTGPSELEAESNAPTEVIRLLNLSRQNAAYTPLP